MTTDGAIVLADGTVFEGVVRGFIPASGIVTGEFVFNTAMSGYQEVITDPSYAGQIITFTYPHLGNYGVTPLDDESTKPWCAGVLARDFVDVPSNWRSVGPLEGFLRQHRVMAMSGIDTRRLTRHLRAHGALPGAFGAASPAELAAAAASASGTENHNFVDLVTCAAPYERGSGSHHVVAFDYGIKTTMVAQLGARFRVTVVPAHTSAAAVRELRPDGVFLSNGPGDPAALPQLAAVVSDLLGTVPIFGICLGHQLLAMALGGKTEKLRFGHHGSNHPVRDARTGAIEITAQNHNYAVRADSIPAQWVTHVNLNDNVIEGLAVEEKRCFSVQYHPEAGPGPHDARYLFDRFEALMNGEVV